MARPLRIEFPGAIYHVTGRRLGDWKKESNRLFEDDQDRSRFVNRLGERVEEFEIRLYLMTLMSNHFHLVLETPRANLGRFMHALSTAYTVYFNRRHQRHGHLLDGRYKAKLVEGDEYLLALTRYVHLNPVYTKDMAGKPLRERIEYLRKYRWSSYPGFIGRRKQFDFIDADPILAMMDCKATDRARCYRQYVETGLAENDEEFIEAMKASPLCIGDEGFRSRILQHYKQLSGKSTKPGDISFRRIIQPLKAETVLGVVCEAFKVGSESLGQKRPHSPLRGVAARMLCRYSGMTQRQVGEMLGIRSDSAVSRQLASLDDRVASDGGLKRRIRVCEKKLGKLREMADGI